MINVLETKNLNLDISGSTILSDINCKFPKGKISVIIGLSGAGKSSLLKSITKLLPATGEIYFENTRLDTLSLQVFRRKVIYVSQIPVVFPGSVEENINWGRELWGWEKVSEKQLLKMVGLDPNLAKRDADDLSVGQQQRLHLARSLALEPEVLLLDEPASGLDAISKEGFENLISTLQNKKPDLSIIMITHDLNQAKRLAEYAILIDKGMISLEAVADDFFKEVQNMSEAEMLEKLLEGDDS